MAERRMGYVMGNAVEGLAFPVLVGDIGGTNARFSIVPDATSDSVLFPILQTKTFPTIDAAIAHVIEQAPATRPRSVMLAVAGPVNGEAIPLTNCPWVVRPRDLIATQGFEQVIVLNDFEAQALAVVSLGSEHLKRIGGAEGHPEGARVVMGPGTGLGVAGLIKSRGVWIPVAGEGGHMDIGPRQGREFEIFPHIEKIEGRIAGEQIMCGRGLVNVYRAVAAVDGVEPKFSDPADITPAALSGSDPQAVEALNLFVTCLGRTAGDLALVFKARGGVYLTGGIAQKIVPALDSGAFRSAFEDKAPHSGWMRDVPVFVMTHPLAALEGLAAYARQPGRFGLETGGRSWRA